MTDLRAMNAVTLSAVLEEDKYITQAPHNGTLDNDAIVLDVGKGKGWMLVTKNSDGAWNAKVYLGARGNASEGVFEDDLDQQWVDSYYAERRNSRLTEHELMVALGLETDDDDLETTDAVRALYLVQSWLNENMWAADTNVTHIGLIRRVPSLRLTQAGGMCPFQAEGTLDGHPFYFRYRGGGMTLRVGQKGATEADFFKPLYMSSMEYGDEYGGSLSPQEFEETFTTLVKELKRAPIFWDFAGNFTEDHFRDKKGDPSKMGSWGNTAQEAWDALHSHDSENLSNERWLEYIKIHGTRFEPLTVDDRMFPDEDPDFTVLD